NSPFDKIVWKGGVKEQIKWSDNGEDPLLSDLDDLTIDLYFANNNVASPTPNNYDKEFDNGSSNKIASSVFGFAGSL
ncbi:23835_t:CDS:2, partial [Dentiscutata erythropus]